MSMRNKFNELPNTVKKSIAEQLKLLAWAIGGINGFFKHSVDFTGVMSIIVGWLLIQIMAHYILFTIKDQKGAE